MSWFNVDDSFPSHPKLEKLEGDPIEHALAVAAWTLLGADCMGRLTDGKFTEQRLARVLPWPKRLRDRARDALLRIGLWERRSSDELQFHDWEDWQRMREEIEATRLTRKTRAKLGAEARWKHKREADASSNASSIDQASASQQCPTPSQATPLKPPTPFSTRKARSSPPLEPPLEELEKRYPEPLLEEVWGSCGAARGTGRVTDRQKRIALIRWSKHSAELVQECMHRYLAKYAGERDERYLSGIIENESKRTLRSRISGHALAPPPLDDDAIGQRNAAILARG